MLGLLPISKISDGTALRVLKRTSVPGCWRKIGAVSTVVVVAWRSCFTFFPGSPLECSGAGVAGIGILTPSFSPTTLLGNIGTSGTVSRSSSPEAADICVFLNWSLSFCSSRRFDCWSTHESIVRKRGTDDRSVIKLSRPIMWLPVSRDGSCGVCGACELVQLNLLTPGPAGRPDTDGRLTRNCLKVGGCRRGDNVCSCTSCIASGYWSSEPSEIDLVLRVEALRRGFWSGRTGEDGVALMLRWCEALVLLRRGGESNRKLCGEVLGDMLLLVLACWLKLDYC